MPPDPPASLRIVEEVLPHMEAADITELCPGKIGCDRVRLRARLLEMTHEQLVDLVSRFSDRNSVRRLGATVFGANPHGRSRREVVRAWLNHIGVRPPALVEGPRRLVRELVRDAERLQSMRQLEAASYDAADAPAHRFQHQFERIIQELVIFAGTLLDGCLEQTNGELEQATSEVQQDLGLEAATGRPMRPLDWILRGATLGPLVATLGRLARAARRHEHMRRLIDHLGRESLLPEGTIAELNGLIPRRNEVSHPGEGPLSERYELNRAAVIHGARILKPLDDQGFLPAVYRPVRREVDRWGDHFTVIDDVDQTRTLNECPFPMELHRTYYAVSRDDEDRTVTFVGARPSQLDGARGT